MNDSGGKEMVDGTIATARLLLRRFSESDIEPFWIYRCDAQVALYQGWVADFSRADAAAFVREQMVQPPGIPGSWQQLALERTADHRLIGDCGLHWLDAARQVELGITLASEYQGMGYAQEALQAVLQYLFASCGCHRITAMTDPRNLACIALLEKLGMRREGHLVKHLYIRGEWVDDLQYAMLAEEWED